MFRYDALAVHADADEYRVIVRNCRGRFFLLGLLVVLMYALPFANLLVPVFGGLMFNQLAAAVSSAPDAVANLIDWLNSTFKP